jgi:hypothetical protein
MNVEESGQWGDARHPPGSKNQDQNLVGTQDQT